MTTDLPWNREEIFHDEFDNYPQPDYFPLTASQSQEEDKYTKPDDKMLNER